MYWYMIFIGSMKSYKKDPCGVWARGRLGSCMWDPKTTNRFIISFACFKSFQVHKAN